MVQQKGHSVKWPQKSDTLTSRCRQKISLRCFHFIQKRPGTEFFLGQWCQLSGFFKILAATSHVPKCNLKGPKQWRETWRHWTLERWRLMSHTALSGNLTDESAFDRYQGNGTLFSGWSTGPLVAVKGTVSCPQICGKALEMAPFYFNMTVHQQHKGV